MSVPAATETPTPRATPRAHTRRRVPPLGIALPAGVAFVFLALPFGALLAAAPWSALPALVASPAVREALWLSLQSASAATVLSVLLGVPLAWVIARGEVPGSGALRAVVTLPLVLPPVVGGVALLMLLGRRGLLGRHLETWFGVTIPFTTLAVVIAATFVAMPFLVVSVEGALRSTDLRLEEAAATLGASRWYTFRRVTLPHVAPGIAAGAVLCFARALGEFGATITFAGNFPGTTRTMPLAVYLALEQDPDAAIALSLVLVAVSLVVLLALRGRWLTRALT